MTQTVLEAQLSALQRATDAGFRNIQKDLDEVKKDVKALNYEGLPRRVSLLEHFRDGLSRKLWALGTGVICALIGVLLTVVLR